MHPALKGNAMFAPTITRLIKRLAQRLGVLMDQNERLRNSFAARRGTDRWCDATERALNNELMGKYGWFNRLDT
jgi:hypothetical protein